MLNDIVDKYNNTVHKTIKIKPVEVMNDYYAEYNEIASKKDPKFKVGEILEFQNMKTFLLKEILQIGHKKILLLIK